jgi:rhamnosyltransferase subunit B
MATLSRRFVFVALGTHGDVLPPLAIAVELVRRGNECVLLAPRRFSELARQQDVEFVCLDDDDDASGQGVEPPATGALERARQRIKQFFRGQGTTESLVVNLAQDCSSNLACEAYGHPAIRLHLAPFHIRSLKSPPWPFRSEMSGPLAYTYATYTLPEMHRRVIADPERLGEVNRERASWNLPNVSSCAPPETSVRQHLALFPAWYCPVAEDWPSNIELPGFPLPESPDLDPWVRSWLDAHSRPIVFTPGTAPGAITEHFFDQAARSCRALNVPGVFLSPKAPRSQGTLPGHILSLPYANLRPLLSRAALLVHHGGIGTTARALQAGIPQIISPLVYDQPDNAERVRLLKVGRRLDRRRFTASNLASSIKALLDDSDVERRLRALQKSILASNCVSRCADVIERSTGQSTPTLEVIGPRLRQRRNQNIKEDVREKFGAI